MQGPNLLRYYRHHVVYKQSLQLEQSKQRLLCPCKFRHRLRLLSVVHQQVAHLKDGAVACLAGY